MPCWLLCVAIIFIRTQIIAENVTDAFSRRFEYKFSFKEPVSSKDGIVPFFNTGGACEADVHLRLNALRRSSRGWIWSQKQTNFQYFRVNMTAKVHGKGAVGAEGFAFWYVESVPSLDDGSAFGSAASWKGLAVMFDTYDNSGKGGHPMVQVYVNNGNIVYNHDADGHSQYIGSCHREYRNKPYPIVIIIQYFGKKLDVYVSAGHRPRINYETDICFTHSNVELLPNGGYFGLTASTGDLADEHEIHYFLVHSLNNKDKGPGETSDTHMFDAEFEAFSHRMKDENEKFTPNEITDKQETAAERNYGLVIDLLIDIQMKNQRGSEMMEELKSLYMMRSQSQQGDRPVDGVHPQNVVGLLTDVRNNMQHDLKSLRQNLDEKLSSKLDRNDFMRQFETLRQKVNDLKLQADKSQELADNIIAGLNNQSTIDCISLRTLLVLLFIQFLAIVLFIMYLSYKEQRAKKLF